ncbi:YfhD family protein [Paenibacillus sp. JX-17]|uniref:YfhD family protein n=1 Tax=Paenibacillus lacisoli TaxID=3064525 RepID=A0ABT9C883_9BACL|nr:YfhD family protein [Paenibacillus sp. JX-17]MDO7905477.1 YfhD family protein [Paenibacillus sp. JX-17]
MAEFQSSRGKILKKTDKMRDLQAAKNEDVEFSGALADHDDVEALRRSEAAERRQERIIFDDK